MAIKTLAVKYRPTTFNDVVEQNNIKIILQQQLEANEVKNAYLFVGGAGTGKTTCARIFANEINHGEGNPIEMDAASNSGVEDVRNITQQAKTKALDSEYKIFIIDECHAISNTGWQAFLKLIEEPPAKSIFIFCTTDPQKIPKTILSRVQRYDFQRISQQGIVNRLDTILENERSEDDAHDIEALEYIAKIADGGMRDAISLMDKCLAYSSELTLENVVKALGTVDYDIMFRLTKSLLQGEALNIMSIIESVHIEGKDLKQFMRQYCQFVLDLNKYAIGCSWDKLNIPKLPEYVEIVDTMHIGGDGVFDILDALINLNSEIKWSTSVKYDIEAKLLLFCLGGGADDRSRAD